MWDRALNSSDIYDIWINNRTFIDYAPVPPATDIASLTVTLDYPINTTYAIVNLTLNSTATPTNLNFTNV